ncbi:glycosyltransferase [Kocuria sp. CPCC 205258]|uniref:glycosyltransferase n=1 Tax=Kocuria sp. CPCC 205258 TaxID=3073552 RepID=UPI0034D40E3E
MKILQIVTYISPDGAYGGPVRVAINQAKALTELGHEVVVAAGAGGFAGPLPHEFDGYPVQLFPARRVTSKAGFAGVFSPALLCWLLNALRYADVVHVHMGRDLVTLPAALIARLTGKPLVVQTHGMIRQSKRRLAKPLDALVTCPILRRAAIVLHLTELEKSKLTDIAGKNLNFYSLRNGVNATDMRAEEQVFGESKNPEVLFLARLHRRKRPMQMVSAAAKLIAKYPHMRFKLVGPDEGEAASVERAIKEYGLEHAVAWEGPIDPLGTGQRMSKASIFALPSTNEPYPMAILEAMAYGLPVVLTDSCGLAPIVEEFNCGVVCDSTSESFEAALDTLMRDSQKRITMGRNSVRVVQDLNSMQAVGEELSGIYRNALAFHLGE